ncbi:aldose epimerase family protein [Tropicimonas sp. TH_r6]|uniref:aldose epimerase family protein n=1 Tax=Tropicimonas sp. TH_r6 TaxID=3082085 RepID=UPI0029534BE2|nr:aldose epimerase family protein [Tropicimonas sp. TH_r6]MDV7145979.1 aldose epimerase family protein [Tropicimonas sp. TH_r6]
MSTTFAKPAPTIQTHRIAGADIQEITLENEAGARASVLSWGAVLRDLQVPLKDGSLRRVVLGYADPELYVVNAPYLGTVVGRVCNRIAHGRFTLDGKSYQLPVNGDGDVHLHGGVKGFTRRNWTVQDAGRDFVLLALVSPDGDEGYPGEVSVTCRYTLTPEAGLRMEIEGQSDAPTLLNMTNHSYFTLLEGATAAEHFLEVASELHTPAQSNQIPTGEVLSSVGTPYDFREERQIGRDYEINFVLRGPRGSARPVARLISPHRDLEMTVITDQPGLLFYTGAGLPEARGPDGQMHGPSLGLCLEAAGFADSVNRPHFPSPVLRPGETYRNICEYRFTAL